MEYEIEITEEEYKAWQSIIKRHAEIDREFDRV